MFSRALRSLAAQPFETYLRLYAKFGTVKAAVCTIVAKNYLAHARVLMESVRLWNPELRRIVILADHIDGYFDPNIEPFDVILSKDLDIPNLKWFHFKYTVLELSTAVKPYALELLLDRFELEKVIYLDPDIKLYSSLRLLLEKLDEHSIVLTPHLTHPLDDGFVPSELDILRCGAYNLGFIGLCDGPEVRRFLEWWRGKLYDLCVVDLPGGLFVDQRWVDLVPGLFSRVGIIQEPGYNIAYWNLNSRKIERVGDSLQVNGQPLYFFHFSGFDPKSPEEFSRHQNRFRLSTLGADTRAMALQYRDDLLSNGFEDCRRWPYAYGRFANGLLIPDIGRSLHRESEEVLTFTEDPFSDEGFQRFVQFWNQPIREDQEAGISRLACRIYRTGTGVHAVMPDALEDSLGAAKKRKTPEKPSGGNHVAPATSGILASADPVRARAGPEKPDKRDRLTVVNGGLKLTRLARIIYETRPELQRIFPDPSGRDRVKFLIWILTYGKKEHLLTDPYLQPLRAQWEAVLISLDSASARLWYRFLLFGMGASVELRSVFAATVTGIRRMRATTPLQRQRIDSPRPASEPNQRKILDSRPTAATLDAPMGPGGFNLVGYIRAETGVGESARAAWRAAIAAGIPVALRDIRTGGEFRTEDHSAGPTTGDFPCPVNLFHVNADQTGVVFGSLDGGFISQKYNIGFWAWELDRFPKRWLSAFDAYQEIWTPSTFCQQSIARESPIAVVHIPLSIHFEPPPAMERGYFGLPSDRFLFLTLFDMLSVFDRKNPLGTVAAFIRAFGADPSVQLIIKINNSQGRSDYLKMLNDSIAGYPITIIDRTFTRNETYGLINACDCLVSLHRSEGFGLTLAEAMYLGKPVIATAYSGNTDFTKVDNSFLVGYRLKPVGKGNEPYDENSLWADPSIEQASQHMRTVKGNPQIRLKVAEAGQEFVRRMLNPEAVGRQMADRLQLIHARSGRRTWQHSALNPNRQFGSASLPRRRGQPTDQNLLPDLQKGPSADGDAANSVQSPVADPGSKA